MDGTESPKGRQRQQPPRASSRSSTHTNNSRMTSLSANSSTSQVAGSPQLSNAHPNHRFHHSNCATNSPRLLSRQTPPLSRQESSESNRQAVMSSFLLERLQKERQAEVDKAVSPSKVNVDMSASLELGRAPSSPSKAGSQDSNRPQSSNGAEQGKKKGLGVKDMEQVISRLHKQNFDLKLELYHRRERQSKLEARVDVLEADKIRTEESNDKLLVELEKRDKAVEEAVAMIVNLEAKVDQLFKERSMVQQIDNEGFFCPQDYEIRYKTPVPQDFEPSRSASDDNAKVINRMPSFLSDNSETTENLRSVYLGTKASTASLARIMEGTPEVDNMRDLGSPTLSMLSESSFLSIYGRKERRYSAGDQSQLDGDETLVQDGAESTFHKTAEEDQRSRSRGSSVLPDPKPRSRTGSGGQFQSITEIVAGSPLQRLERLDGGYQGRRDTTQPNNRTRDNARMVEVNDSRQAGYRNAGRDKREALRRVVTDAPGGARLLDHGLPPTPDTISSGTLRRVQGSNDTLSQEREIPGGGANNGALLQTKKQEGTPESRPTVQFEQNEARNFGLNKAIVGNVDALFEHRAPLIQRPRSADESTISHRRGKAWYSDDEEDDDDSDTRSLQSSLDIWMKESVKPSRNEGRASPDLFSFPMDASRGGWATNSMFRDTNNAPGQGPSAPGFEYMRDLFSVRQGLFSDAAPPPPNRRSSLHARVGSAAETAGQVGGTQSTETWESRREPPRQYNRESSAEPSRRAEMKTPVQREQISRPPPPSSEQKKSQHHPPLSGQHTARTGLNRLFRRSSGSGSSAPVPHPDVNAVKGMEAPTSTTNKPHGSIGIPSWANGSSAGEEDRSGATPPPIMFNPRQMRRNTMDAESDLPAPQELKRSNTPLAQVQASTNYAAEEAVEGNAGVDVPAAGAGGRRKWLSGFSRASNGKNKAG